MSINNDTKQRVNKAYYSSLYVFLFFLFIFNIGVFIHYISSNSFFLTEYKSPVDELAWFRNPVIMLKFNDANAKTKIVVLPDNIHVHPYVKNYQDLFSGYDKIFVAKNTKTTKEHLQYIKKISNKIVQDSEFTEDIVNENVLIVWFDDIENYTSEFEKIKTFVKKHNLIPATSDLLDLLQMKNVLKIKKNKKRNTLNNQYQNLKNFVQDYEQQLMTIISKNEQDTQYDKHFYDKAAVSVLTCNEDYNCKEYMDIDFNRPLLKSLTNTLNEAEKDNYKTLKVFLLTKFEKQNFKTEEEFLNSLDKTIGVYIKRGMLSGIMLPYFWKKYKNNKDFVNQLKIKSGINPDYFNDDMQIYYFKAVEVPYVN